MFEALKKWWRKPNGSAPEDAKAPTAAPVPEAGVRPEPPGAHGWPIVESILMRHACETDRGCDGLASCATNQSCELVQTSCLPRG